MNQNQNDLVASITFVMYTIGVLTTIFNSKSFASPQVKTISIPPKPIEVEGSDDDDYDDDENERLLKKNRILAKKQVGAIRLSDTRSRI